MEVSQQPIHQLLMHKGLGHQRRRRGRLEKIGQQQHHDQTTNEIVQADHRIDTACDGQTTLRIGHGMHQLLVQPIPPEILRAAEDGGLLQRRPQGHRIKTRTGDGMGHRQEGVRGKTDDHP